MTRFTRCRTFVRRGLIGLGGVFLVWIALCCTRLPARAYQWLSEDPAQRRLRDPELIVVLGGGGIPSESGLLRCYFGAQAARTYPGARVLVSLPADGDPERSSVGRMRNELVMRGIDRARIDLEHDARSTHEQAEAVRALMRDRPDTRILLVTSEFHIRRSLLAFRKAGLDVGAEVVDTLAPEAGMGAFTGVRYYFWYNLTNSIVLARELTAMVAYRLRGWI
jgi:uncharacterized SAM-binding protein YcdF (DUF218 family)